MTDAPLPAPGTTVRLERLLPAPVAEVFAAWTDPALMARWLSPTGHAEAKTDLRVGGKFTVTMIGDDLRLEHTGEYLVIDPPRRLSFTWSSPYTGVHPSQVDVVLTDRGSSTLLVVEHTRLPESTRTSHEGGWVTILEHLRTLLKDQVNTSSLSRDAAL